jgi:hypothetical protein
MNERIEEELALLRHDYDEVEYVAEGGWVRVWPVTTGPGWSEDPVPAAFQIPAGFPGAPPYGFYVPVGLTHNGGQPQNYQARASSQPPFGGEWAMFSWAQDGGWRATSDLVTGSNLLNWSRSFRDRFAEGV